jgi:DUF1680 family protein
VVGEGAKPSKSAPAGSWRVDSAGHLWPAVTPARLTAVPYHAWGNRGVRAMRVWAPLVGTGPA